MKLNRICKIFTWPRRTWILRGARSAPAATLRQDEYWLLDLKARYEITRQESVTDHVNNVFDKHYHAGVTNFTSQVLFYTWGAPRSAA